MVFSSESRYLGKDLNIKIHKTVTLSAVLYGCETKEDDRLMVFENRVLKRIFGRKTDDVITLKNYIIKIFII
jgi:hypothetical protein